MYSVHYTLSRVPRQERGSAQRRRIALYGEAQFLEHAQVPLSGRAGLRAGAVRGNVRVSTLQGCVCVHCVMSA